MFVPGAFRDDLGQEMPFAYVDKYRRGVLNGYSVSRPDVLPEVNQNIIQFETKGRRQLMTRCSGLVAQKELDWYITFVAEIMACNTNSQAAYGQGMSSMPYSDSPVTVATIDANTVIVSNATASTFKVSMNIAVGTSREISQYLAIGSLLK